MNKFKGSASHDTNTYLAAMERMRNYHRAIPGGSKITVAGKERTMQLISAITVLVFKK